MKPIEEWKKLKKTEAWKFAAAKALSNWPVGKEVTEKEYNEAINAASNLKVR